MDHVFLYNMMTIWSLVQGCLANLAEAVIASVSGNVLIPVDAAGRVLELVLLLEEHWDKQKLAYPLALLSPMAYNVLELASSQLEWMSHYVGQMFERTKHNPFAVRRDQYLSRSCHQSYFPSPTNCLWLRSRADETMQAI